MRLHPSARHVPVLAAVTGLLASGAEPARAVVPVELSPPGQVTAVAAVADGGGGGVAVWAQDPAPGGAGVFARVVDPRARPRGRPFAVSRNPITDDLLAARGPRGGALVVWAAGASSVPFRSTWRARRITAGGRAVSRAVTLGPRAAAGAGRGAVAWSGAVGGWVVALPTPGGTRLVLVGPDGRVARARTSALAVEAVVARGRGWVAAVRAASGGLTTRAVSPRLGVGRPQGSLATAARPAVTQGCGAVFAVERRSSLTRLQLLDTHLRTVRTVDRDAWQAARRAVVCTPRVVASAGLILDEVDRGTRARLRVHRLDLRTGLEAGGPVPLGAHVEPSAPAVLAGASGPIVLAGAISTVTARGVLIALRP